MKPPRYPSLEDQPLEPKGYDKFCRTESSWLRQDSGSLLHGSIIPFQALRVLPGAQQADKSGVAKRFAMSLLFSPSLRSCFPLKLFWRGWGDTIATLMHETMLRVQPRALVSARKGSGWNVRNGKPRDQEA